MGAADPSPVARLIWRRADGSEVTFELGERPAVVGRDETADIRIDEPLVSRSHARIEPRDGRLYLCDLGSTNLTRVNGSVVAESYLDDGDELRFGRAVCVVRLKDAGA